MTHAKEMEQMENLVKQLTAQLKKLKQEAHMKQLELQKKDSALQDAEFELKKIKKENDFLKNRVESLDLQNSELRLKKQFTADDDGVNDLAEMEDVEASKDQQIEDLKDEIGLLQKNNQMLISAQSDGKEELLKKIYELEQANDDKDFELKAMSEKKGIVEGQLTKLRKEYDLLETKLSSEIKNDSNILNELRQQRDRETSEKSFGMSSHQSVTILEKDLELAREKSKNAELQADSLLRQINSLQKQHKNEIEHVKNKMKRDFEA